MPVAVFRQSEQARLYVGSGLRREKCKWQTHKHESTESGYGEHRTGTEGPVVAKKPGNAGGAKGSHFSVKGKGSTNNGGALEQDHYEIVVARAVAGTGPVRLKAQDVLQP